MNIEEIRKGAPDGATHYRDYGSLIIYYMDEPPSTYRFKKLFSKWVYCQHTSNELKPLY